MHDERIRFDISLGNSVHTLTTFTKEEIQGNHNYVFFVHLADKDIRSIGYRNCSSILQITVSELLCHRRPWICSICHRQKPILFSFMTYHRIFSMKDKTCAASGEETAYLLLLTPAFKSAFFLFFVWICLLTVSFEHCIIWPSIYGFWYPLRYL